jgi:selenocysteine-specific elongation factor
MKSIIVGTAGHIDHGKTALVKALTGIDADRLEEEKRRGITIDIGFAHLELPSPGEETLRFSFVDVPGHERFVSNMLAGIGGIDLVLFVVAADEGIMPQTREHFDICRLLAVKRGITVLTKSDLVDAETLEVARIEIAEFVRGSFLDSNQSPIIAVNTINGSGIEQLKSAMINVGAEVPAKITQAPARLPIDRVFTMKGFGAVVTGTLISGTVASEDELEIFPEGRKVRVRRVQVHGQPVDQAVAGERTALNLTGIAKDDMSRGMTLAAPNAFQTTSQIDVSLNLLPSAKDLKDRTRIHCHSYTFETIAEVRLHGTNKLDHGGTAFACLRLSKPALILPGDRFIIRQLSPLTTIGGGVVLDAAPLRTVPKKARAEFLQVFADGDPQDILRARVSRRGARGLSIAQAIAETGWRKEDLERNLNGLVLMNEVFGRTVSISANAVNDLKSHALVAVTNYHDKNPLVAAMNKEALRETLHIGPEIFDLVSELLVKDKKLDVVGDGIRLPGRGVVMKDEEAEAKRIIESDFRRAGLQVPALKDVLDGLKVDKARAQKLVTLMLRDKVLVKVSDDLVFHHSALQDLRKRLSSEKLKSPKIDVAKFKDLTGVSRKYAIPLLEYLDRERVTRREADARVIL